MKFLYHIPSVNTINAGRTYFEGYRNATLDLGHSFKPLTADDDLKDIISKYKPNIFITGLSHYNLKYLDLETLKNAKKKGLKVFVNVPFWKSPISKLRLNETGGISNNQDWIKLISSGMFGDVYYNICEQGDERMAGFEKNTGYKPQTLLLAADKLLAQQKLHSNFKFKADLSFIGTYLPERRAFMKRCVFPLKSHYNYDLKLFCQDLTFVDRSLNAIQKVGQYFNIPYLKSFKKNNVTFEEERIILQSSTICLNFHENYQKKYGDFNDRTFKIPAYGGFEITDNVPTIRRYLKDGKEIVIANNDTDWFEKIEYFLKNPNKRLPIIKAGNKKVLKYHTYHNRVEQMINLYKKIS